MAKHGGDHTDIYIFFFLKYSETVSGMISGILSGILLGNPFGIRFFFLAFIWYFPLTSFLAPLSSFLSPLAFLLSPFSFLQCRLSSAFLCLSPVRSVSSLLFLPLLSLHSALLSPLFLSPQPIFFSFLCPLFSLPCPVSSFLSAFLSKILVPHAVRKLNENPNIRDASGVKRICTQTGQPAKEHEQSWNLELIRS